MGRMCQLRFGTLVVVCMYMHTPVINANVCVNRYHWDLQDKGKGSTKNIFQNRQKMEVPNHAGN